jgi:hypothetical protein
VTHDFSVVCHDKQPRIQLQLLQVLPAKAIGIVLACIKSDMKINHVDFEEISL